MSATDRVGIEIDLMGYEDAVKQMQNLDNMVKGLSGRKGYLKIKAEVDKLRINRDALKAHKVKLQSDMSDINRDIKKAKELLKSLEGQRPLFAKDSASAKRLEVEIGRLKNTIASLEGQKLGIDAELKQTQEEINQTIAYMQRLNAAMKNAGMNGKSLGQIFNKISTSMAHAGSAMQSAGNAISRFMTPFRMLTTGAFLGAGFGAMSKVTEGLSSGFSRYDTMKKYPRIMEQMGYSSKQAESSVAKLDKAVQGLPTGLDEIVQMAQRYTLTLGDIDKGTNLAIAANNAFLASMSTDTQKYQGMMQLQDLMTGKKLRNTEWTSLINSMSAGINEVGKELGYADDEMDKFKKDLLANKIAPKEFLDALEKVGTGSGKLAKLANQSKDTWEAFSSRIGTAFSRMTYGVLQNLDKVVKIATGGEFKSLNSFLDKKVIRGIDGLTKSVKGWIKAHPDEIIDFFNDIKSIDWKGLGKGVVEGVGEIIKVVQNMAEWLGGRSLEGVGKWLVRLNMIGQGLLVFGGMVKGLRGVGGVLGAVGVGVARLIGGLGVAGAGKKLKSVAEFFKGFGKLGKVAGTAKTASGVANVAKLGSTFKAFVPALEAIAGIGAITTSISAIAMIDTKLLSMAMTNVKTITADMGAVLRNIKGLRTEGFDVSGLRTAVNDIFSIYDIIYGETTGYQATGKTFKQNRETGFADFDKGFLSDLSESMGSMVEIFASMNTMQYSLKGMKGFKKFDESITEGITNFATSLGGIYTSFSTAFQNGVDDKQAEGFASIVESTKRMFGNLNTIAQTIPDLVNNLASGVGTQVGRGSPIERLRNMLIGEGHVSGGLVDATKSGGLFGALRDIMSTLNTSFGNMDTGGLSEKASQISSAIQSIKQIGNKLASIGGEGGFGANTEGMSAGINAIKTMISQLGTVLNTETLGSISMQIGTFQTSVENLFNTLNGDLNGVKVTVKIDGKVEGDDDLISDINKAKDAIKSAVKNIPSDIYKYVTIHINGTVEKSLPTLPSLPGINPHTGGYIAGAGKLLYRKSGGGIPVFKPKGTDTVPAMLTPGEYVTRKKAVDYFGVRFMQKINNLDVRGAMKELSARAGSMASFNRGSSITNNITNNNNQQVVQNINTNNPNFAFKRSNRFITALT